MNHSVLQRWVAAVSLFVLLPISMLAQIPEVDTLRAQINQNPDNRALKCQKCHAFAAYGMLDSAENCLTKTGITPSDSPKLKVLAALTGAYMDAYYGHYETAKEQLDSAMKMVKAHSFDFDFKAESFIQVMNAFSYNYACKSGMDATEGFIQLCKEHGADSLHVFGLTYLIQFAECLEYSEEQIVNYHQKAYATAQEQPEVLATLEYELGLVDYYYERLPSAISHFLTAEQYLNKDHQKLQLFNIYASFSDAYDELNDFGRSIFYLKKAMPLVPHIPKHRLGDFFNVVGWSYYRYGEIDSALHYIRQSQACYENYQPGNPDIAYPLGNLGLIYNKSGKLDSAAIFSKKAIELFKVSNYLTGVAEAENNLGNISLKLGKRSNAEKHFLTALNIAKDYTALFEEMNALEGLIKVYREPSPSKALEYYDRYHTLKLHFQSKEDAMKALQIETTYFEEQAENQIEQLELESKRKGLELERNNLKLVSISIGLIMALIIAGVFYFYWYQYQKLTRSLQESNDVNQRIISMISHDFRGPLNNIKLSLELLQSNDLEPNEFQILAKDLYRQSSDVALMFDSFVGWAMAQKDGYVPSKAQFDWSEVINETININQPLADLKNISLQVSAQESIKVETDLMAVSLIFRNLLSNAIKYSDKDSEVSIKSHKDGEEVVTTIEDHGVGMSKVKLNKILTTGDGSAPGTEQEYGAGLGLKMVIRYVKGLNGSIKAESLEGRGTKFVVRIPMRLINTPPSA